MSKKLSNLLSLNILSRVLQSLTAMVQRFPLAVFALVVINLISLFQIHNFNVLTNEQFGKILLAAITAFLWFIASTQFAESRHWNRVKAYLLSIPVYLLIGWYIALLQPWSLSLWALLIAAGLTISFSAWLFRGSNNDSVWFFNYQLISAVFFAFLSAFILCGGFSLIFASMEYLFEIDISGKVYADLWLLGMAMIAPVYLLVNIPEQFDYPRSECQFPKGVYFILSYILVPLSLLYMVILYAYMIKILFQWELPQGQLGTMISVFGAIGIFTHVAIYPVQNQGYALLGWFYRYFYLAMLVPLGLLSLAIGERISQYGVTDLRYIVAVIAIWFAILIISYIFKRQQFRLQQVTLSLALLIFLSSFGPWGIQQLPVNNQLSRLKSVLIKENILVNGQLNVIQQPDILVRKSIISMMTYLLENNAATKLRPWFENKQSFDIVLKCEVTNSCRRSDAKQLVSLMKLDYVDSWVQENAGELIEISRSNINIINHTESMFSVSGYDFFIPVYRLSSIKNYSIRLQNNFTKELSEFNLKLDKQGLLSLSTTGGDSISFDLIKLAAQFSTANLSQIIVIKHDKLVLKQSNQQFAGTLYVDQLKLRKNSVESLSGRLLIKLAD